MSYFGEVCAVGPWVETMNDNYADLCRCDAGMMGQDHLRTSEQDADIANRIALLWNLTLNLTDEQILDMFDV